MADRISKARKVLAEVMTEFGPAREHAASAGREFLLAVRSAVEAELAVLDRLMAAPPEAAERVIRVPIEEVSPEQAVPESPPAAARPAEEPHPRPAGHDFERLRKGPGAPGMAEKPPRPETVIP